MSTPDWITLEQLDQTFGGRRPLIIKLLGIFVKTYSEFPEQMKACAHAGDEKNFAMQLHSLKGACASLGAQALRERVAGLESRLKNNESPSTTLADELFSFWPHVMQNARSVLDILQR